MYLSQVLHEKNSITQAVCCSEVREKYSVQDLLPEPTNNSKFLQILGLVYLCCDLSSHSPIT